MDSLLSDEDIKDKGNKEMYLNVFDGKRNRATVQRGYSLIQLLVVILVASILAMAAFTAYRESVRSANLRAAHAALLENARFMEQFYTKKGSFKLTSTKWPELPVKEAGGFCIRMSGQAKGILEGKFTLKAVALDREAEPRVLRLNESLTAVVCEKMKGKGSCMDGEEIFRGNDAECKPFGA